jgi:cell division septal protein FtsQ
VAARKRSNARAARLPVRRAAPSLASIAPSGRSLATGIALLLLAVGAYAVARGTSIFAVRTVEIRGGTPALQAQVRGALKDEVGQSLLKVDGTSLARRVEPLPGVRSFEYDRSFPSTLRVVITPERPVLVLRRGREAFLVSTTGRVVAPMPHPRLSHLPRLWAPRDVDVSVGRSLPAALLPAAIALAPLRAAPLPTGVRTIRAGKELTITLGSGLEVRLGDSTDVRLKLAIARKILLETGAAAAGGGYVDVSVPERPVLSPNSQPAG